MLEDLYPSVTRTHRFDCVSTNPARFGWNQNPHLSYSKSNYDLAPDLV